MRKMSYSNTPRLKHAVIQRKIATPRLKIARRSYDVWPDILSHTFSVCEKAHTEKAWLREAMVLMRKRQVQRS